MPRIAPPAGFPFHAGLTVTLGIKTCSNSVLTPSRNPSKAVLGRASGRAKSWLLEIWLSQVWVSRGRFWAEGSNDAASRETQHRPCQAGGPGGRRSHGRQPCPCLV